jgi:hypothetical protein
VIVLGHTVVVRIFLTFKGKHALKIELKFNPALPKTSDPPIASSFDGLKPLTETDDTAFSPKAVPGILSTQRWEDVGTEACLIFCELGKPSGRMI